MIYKTLQIVLSVSGGILFSIASTIEPKVAPYVIIGALAVCFSMILAMKED